MVNNLPASAGGMRRWFNTWRGRTAWQPTPVFLSGEPHGQRNPPGYSAGGHKESDVTEAA